MAAQPPPIPEQRAKQVPKRSSKKVGRVVRYRLKDGTLQTKTYPPYKPRLRTRGDTVGDLIKAWEGSPEWAKLAPRTKYHYAHYARHILCMEQVEVRRVSRADLFDLRDAIATASGHGAATGFSRTMSALFGFAVEREWIAVAPTAKLRRGLESGHWPAWTPADAALALAHLPEPLRRAVVLALYTGQRRGDLIRMAWSAYDGSRIRLVQEKTGGPLVIPAAAELRAELDDWRQNAASTLILTGTTGRPWRAENLSKQLGKALARIEGFPTHRNIHGLRKLAASNLAQAGCTLHEIAAITGHKSLAMLQLYTASVDQERAAEAAIIKLAERRK